MLQIDSHWVWDFWLAHDGTQHHLFFLWAPKSLGDETRRHRNARIGHASSIDLVNWTLLPEAFGPVAQAFSMRRRPGPAVLSGIPING